jgi:hypothetical protein
MIMLTSIAGMFCQIKQIKDPDQLNRGISGPSKKQQHIPWPAAILISSHAVCRNKFLFIDILLFGMEMYRLMK